MRRAPGHGVSLESSLHSWGHAMADSAIPQRRTGRFELDKTTAEHDGDEGRKQHGYPTSEATAL